MSSADQRRLERRGEIVQAYWRVAKAHPGRSVNIRTVAGEAEMSPANVLHYFDTLKELQFVAINGAMEEFWTRRQAILDQPVSASARLWQMIDAGVPDVISVELRQVYESVSVLAEHPEFLHAHRALTERQIMLYRTLIEIGARTREFEPASPLRMIARNLVALEDAYDLYPLVGDTTPREECRLAVRSYAEIALGVIAPDRNSG
jgi:AcrR family transcriptional regulator